MEGAAISSWASNLNLTTVAALIIFVTYVVWEAIGTAPQGIVSLLGVAGGAWFGALAEDRARRTREAERQAERLAEAEKGAAAAEAKADKLAAAPLNTSIRDQRGGSPMSSVLSHIFSWTFLGGFMVGLLTNRAIAWARARWEDRHHPLPGGRKHHAGALNRMWVGGLIALSLLGWSIYKTQQNSDTADRLTRDGRQFAAEVQDCQRQFNEALRARAKISDDNDRWSAIQRKALGDWLHEALVPPPEIQKLRDAGDYTNPAYTQWGIDVTTKYYQIIEQAQREQDENQAERATHPLPEPTCGK